MKENKSVRRKKEKSDHATVHKVLDHTSMGIIESLKRRKKLFNVGPPISTGKEAVIFPGECVQDMETKYININKRGTNRDRGTNSKRDNTNNTSNNKRDTNINNRDNTSDYSTSVAPVFVVPCVIKVFKTSTMFFKDRSKYIQNEKRFTNLCTSNSRKLIKVWAEKEVRNLKRLNKSKIPSPVPLYLKKNVLIMTMITQTELGDKERDNNNNNERDNINSERDINNNERDPSYNNRDPSYNNNSNPSYKYAIPALRLRDLPSLSYSDYLSTLSLLHSLYSSASLVHADFSEYNILIDDNLTQYIIDVGQSVDRSHENSLYFLISDITNINTFYRSRGVEVRSGNGIFESITGLRIPGYLQGVELNKNSHIPTSLGEIANIEDSEIFMARGLTRRERDIEGVEGDIESDIEYSGSTDQNTDQEYSNDQKYSGSTDQEYSTNDEYSNDDDYYSDCYSDRLSCELLSDPIVYSTDHVSSTDNYSDCDSSYEYYGVESKTYQEVEEINSEEGNNEGDSEGDISSEEEIYSDVSDVSDVGGLNGLTVKLDRVSVREQKKQEKKKTKEKNRERRKKRVEKEREHSKRT